MIQGIITFVLIYCFFKLLNIIIYKTKTLLNKNTNSSIPTIDLVENKITVQSKSTEKIEDVIENDNSLSIVIWIAVFLFTLFFIFVKNTTYNSLVYFLLAYFSLSIIITIVLMTVALKKQRVNSEQPSDILNIKETLENFKSKTKILLVNIFRLVLYALIASVALLILFFLVKAMKPMGFAVAIMLFSPIIEIGAYIGAFIIILYLIVSWFIPKLSFVKFIMWLLVIIALFGYCSSLVIQ